MSKKNRKPKVIESRTYSQALGEVIEQEFFPDLPRLRSLHASETTRKRKPEVIDLTDTNLDEFHANISSSDELAFRNLQVLDRKRHMHNWSRLVPTEEPSEVALRIHAAANVDNHASSRSIVRKENTRLVEAATKYPLDSTIQGTLSAKSVLQKSRHRADDMVRNGKFDESTYSLPPIDSREQVAMKLEQSVSRDILHAGLRRKK